jgi:hypothetical protein
MRYLILCFTMISLLACNGQDGTDGQPCTASSNEDGSYIISCPNSDPISVTNGSNGKIFFGNITNQRELNLLMDGAYSIILGYLDISFFEGSELDLSFLEHIEGSFTLEYNPTLISLKLSSLASVGGAFIIEDNDALTYLSLPHLSSVDFLIDVRSNDALTTCEIPLIDDSRLPPICQ